MPDDEATYRIDPFARGDLEARFRALLTRLEPVLAASDIASVRILLDGGDPAGAFARLDTLTDDATVAFETSVLVELVLLGEACRSA
jgi:hypothetical protein